MSQIGYNRKRAEEYANLRWRARYASDCCLCGGRIQQGDTVRWEQRDVVHADCEAES